MNKKMGIVLATLFVILTAGVMVYSNTAKTMGQDIGDIATQNICTLPGNIVRIEIKEENTTTRLERQGQTWINLDYEEITYDWLKLHTWLMNFREVTSESIIEEVEDLTIYNINDTSDIITLYDEMNNAQTFKISNLKNENDNIYIATDEIKGIYKIGEENKSIFEEDINNFVISEEFISSIEDIKNIIIDNKKSKQVILSKDEKNQDNLWSLKGSYELAYKANLEQIEKILETLLKVNNNTFEGVKSQNNDYGISNSNFSMVINEDINIVFGDINKDKVYMNVNNDDFIYSIDYSVVSELEKLQAFDLIDKEIINITSSNFKEIIFENPQGKYTLKSDETTNNIFNLNDKSLVEEDKQDLIKLINQSVSLAEVLNHPAIEQKEARPAESTITCIMNDGQVIKTELIPYDINYYLLRMDGITEFAVNKDKVTTLFSKLNNLIKK